MQLTNNTNIPLSLAVWLADDDYDHSDDPNIISATSLLKPIKAITLARQNADLNKAADISSLIPSRMGTALHSAIEKSWESGQLYEILESLGYSKEIIDKIEINPKPENIGPNTIPIYMENRAHKSIGGYTISGKYDFVMNGVLEDFKSTGTYNYISGSNTEKYRQQGSIYRWLNPQIITEDYMKIQYLFTDWSSVKAIQDKNYPTSRLVEQKIELMSYAETEAFILKIINRIKQYESADQGQIPACTDEELWRKPAVFKYYKDATKLTRSTKNFDNKGDAIQRLISDGNKGIVKDFPGQVVRCRYCDVRGICEQAQGYINEGLLTL